MAAQAPLAAPSRPPLPTYRELLVTWGVPGGVGILGVLSICLWLSASPPIEDNQLRAPTAVTSPLAPGMTQPGGAQPGLPGGMTPIVPGGAAAPLTPGGPGAAGMPVELPSNEPPALGNAVPSPGEPGADPPGGVDIMGGGADPGGPSPGGPGGGMPPFGGGGMMPSGPPAGGGPSRSPEPAGDEEPIPPISQKRPNPSSRGGALAIGSWSGFRGPNLDNISKEAVPLARGWGAGGPPRLWQAALGEGHAGPAVRNGRIYILDYDQQARADVLRCLSLDNGKQIWSSSYAVEVKRNHGMSRTVPAVTDKYVVTLGPKCHVMCCDAGTGKVIWRKDLVKEYGTKVPTWYAGQCPLVDGSRAIIAPAGSALMIAVDLASGKVQWRTPNPRKWNMTHSSIAPMTFGGQRMYVYCGSGGVAGVSATDGRILWDTTEWKVSTATVPTPVPIGDGRIFLCGGYNSGAMMLRLKQSGGKIAPEIAFRLKVDVFGSDQQTPILHNGHLYGVVPNPAGQLACLDLNGRRLWTSGRTNTFGLGPYVMAGGLLYVLGDKGDLALVEPGPAGYKQLSKAKVLQGHDAWGPMAIVAGRLLARDLTTLVCLDVKRP